MNYYKCVGIDAVDLTYLKTIRKRSRKEDLLRPMALAKAAETIIDLPGNREIAKIMKEYYEQYTEKFGVALAPKKASLSPKKTVLVPKKEKNTT